jgi:hypothetical protein
MHHKLIVFGIVLVVVVVFGSIFWNDLVSNQREISNLQTSPETDANQDILPNPAHEGMSESDDYDSMEKDMNQTDVNGVDAGSAELQAESSTL